MSSASLQHHSSTGFLSQVVRKAGIIKIFLSLKHSIQNNVGGCNWNSLTILLANRRLQMCGNKKAVKNSVCLDHFYLLHISSYMTNTNCSGKTVQGSAAYLMSSHLILAQLISVYFSWFKFSAFLCKALLYGVGGPHCQIYIFFQHPPIPSFPHLFLYELHILPDVRTFVSFSLSLTASLPGILNRPPKNKEI